MRNSSSNLVLLRGPSIYDGSLPNSKHLLLFFITLLPNGNKSSLPHSNV